MTEVTQHTHTHQERKRGWWDKAERGVHKRAVGWVVREDFSENMILEQDEEKEGEISGMMAQNMIIPVNKQLA